jgi:hypothetical protein
MGQLSDQIVACSFWNLESLWPVPVWWIGIKTQSKSELQKLEALTEERTELIETWQSYNSRRQRVKIMVMPTPAVRYAMILIVRD